MPDITMCVGGECPIKEDCYRFIAEPNPYWQSYFENVPYDFEKKDCNYYMEKRE
jgi:hypothetical protein